MDDLAVQNFDERYMDALNATYLEVMRSCWPSALENMQISHEETGGDLVEAVSGGYCVLTVKQGMEFDFSVHDFIEMLERACLGVYVKNHGH